MACNCGKNRAATASGTSTAPTTYSVMVGGKVVYQSSSKQSADTVAARFADATVVAPGETS